MSGSSKQPAKNEENFSKMKEKMQRLFGFGKSSAPLAVPKTTTREVVFTPEILKVRLANIGTGCFFKLIDVACLCPLLLKRPILLSVSRRVGLKLVD